MSTSPTLCRADIVSPKIMMPKNIAVTGSNCGWGGADALDCGGGAQEGYRRGKYGKTQHVAPHIPVRRHRYLSNPQQSDYEHREPEHENVERDFQCRLVLDGFHAVYANELDGIGERREKHDD